MAQPARYPVSDDHHPSSFDDRPQTPVSPIARQSVEFSTPSSARRSKHASVLTFNGEELTWPAMSRPESAASDRVSVVSGLAQHFPSSALNVNPAPAYVAPAGAAQVVSEHRSGAARSLSDGEDGRQPSKEDITFADPALALINQFLDQLLYSFLSSARSTNMAALRPAVTDVLKQRLAREAIMSAEEELAELLAGGDDEAETDGGNTTAEIGRSWDTELVWKRTRLRVMVYMRLGEMEDDDEQRYVRDEELFHGGERRFSSTSGLVSWAAAIFLTSVLEYVAEQTLQVAGSAAHARVLRQARSSGTTAGNIVVEEHDVEKVALNSTLGRLWRTWRKSLRNHINSAATVPAAEQSPSTPTSRDTLHTPMEDRRGSLGAVAESVMPSTAGSSIPVGDNPELDYPEYVLAANIPLPMSNMVRDAHEIEVPGLAVDPDDDELLREILLSYLALSAHMPLPGNSRDVHEIEVPGLARDVDDEDESQARHQERAFAAGLALPMKDDKRDVDEIEVPGLATDPDTEELSVLVPPARRNSFTHSRSMHIVGGLPTPDSSQPGSPTTQGRGMVRRRSSSVPTPVRRTIRPNDDNVPALPAATEKQQSLQPSVDEQVEKQPEESSNTGIVAGAVAGAAAVGAAITAAVVGSKDDEQESTRPDPIEQPSVRDLQPGSNKTAAEIEELDKRKSLLDIKAMAGIAPTPPPVASRKSTPENATAQPVTPPPTDAIADGTAMNPEVTGRPSYESYSLGHGQSLRDRESGEEISSEEGPQDAEAIGVAQTSDVPYTSPGKGSPEQDARERRGPTRVILGEDAPDSPTIKQLRTSTDGTTRPRSFSRKSEVSLTDQNRFVAQQLAQQRGIPPSPSSSRRVPTDASEQSRPYSQSTLGKQGSQVYEHPVVQRMASLKRNKPTVTDDQGNSLTSASIRGPEDFDVFVQGAETMKYTLTPEAVRDESVRSSQAGAERDMVASPAASNAEALRQLEAGASTDSRASRSRSEKPSTSTAEEEEARKRQHRRSISRPPTTNTKAHNKSGLMAREPRVQTESTRDFADFIRSTGPDKEASIYPLMNNVSSTSLSSMRSAHINGASASRSSSPAASRAQSLKNGAGGENVPPVPPIPTTSKGTMQPRGANGVSPGNADLIDFIRSGPVDKDKHRISRSVAPFRNTMDSEQFRDMDSRLSSDRPVDQSLKTHNGQSAPSSQRTSLNSRSALLNGAGNAATAHPAYSGTPQSLASPVQPSQPARKPSVHDSEPTKKRYRNKDPYAIDFSDEDDDLVTALPAGSARKEESLVDFLNSMEPPKDSGPPEPLINPNSAQAKKLIQDARANGLNSSTRSLQGDGRSKTTQSNPGPRPGYASSVTSARSNGSRPYPAGTQFVNTSIRAGNAPRPKMIARTSDSRSQANSTNDLASFLRDSGPPEDPESAPAPNVGRAKTSAKPEKDKKKSAFNLFGKTKKKAYLDMS